MGDFVSADTDRLAHFVDRGEVYVASLQSIFNDVAQVRAVAQNALNHAVGGSAERKFAELLVEATTNNLYVESVHDALVATPGEATIVTVPVSVVEQALRDRGLDLVGFDRTLGRDAENLDGALQEALADRDLVQARRIRELMALAAEADGQLSAEEQTSFDELTADGVPAYPAFLLSTMTPEQVTDQLRADVYAEAGISADRWDPSLGVSHNRSTIDAVYEYYPELYAIDPNMQWVGLASIAAPQFYAGFLDISDLHTVVTTGGDFAEAVKEASVPPALAARLAELSAEELADGLWFMETQFLDMQKQIFDDMAVQHYAYQVGGIELIDAFATGIADQQLPLDDQVSETREPWEEFAAGKIDESTGLLVDREQRGIIQDDYDDIWNHSTATKLFVTAAGFTAVDPSGGPSFLDHVLTPDLANPELNIPDFTGRTPDIPGVETPPVQLGGPGGPSVVWNPPDIPGLSIPDLPSFDTPDISIDIDGLDPSANVANEEDRMKWIEEVVNAMVIDRWHEDPQGLQAQTQLDLHTEVEKYRQVPAFARP